jgi:glycosyltransferase involved in cell wall biosynthesis
MENVFIAKAAAVIVPNEALQEEVLSRHGVEAKIVRNPAISLPEPGPIASTLSPPDSPLIVYTGAVYHVNYAAFRTLIAAMGRLSGKQPRLDIYSAQDPAQLKLEGLRGPEVRLLPHVEPDQAARIQWQADVLFMGFSFDSEVPVVIRTSAPGKLGDYLASGRPILALVPADSFLAQYLRDHRCGLVVDQDDPDLLAVALGRLLHEPGLAATLVENALTQARTEFAPEVATRRFLHVLEQAR